MGNPFNVFPCLPKLAEDFCALFMLVPQENWATSPKDVSRRSLPGRHPLEYIISNHTTLSAPRAVRSNDVDWSLRYTAGVYDHVATMANKASMTF